MIVRKVSDRMALRAIDGLHPDVVRSVVNYPISHILSIRREFQGGGDGRLRGEYLPGIRGVGHHVNQHECGALPLPC